jgi:predicted  nucleic acid-binding Zn-ribbon protein
VGRCHSCGNQFAEGEVLCRKCGANLLRATSSQPQLDPPAPERNRSHALWGMDGRILFAVVLVIVLGVALAANSLFVPVASQVQVRATQTAANEEDRSASLASTAAVRATNAAEVARVHAESTVDAQLSSGISRLRSQATTVARDTATAQGHRRAIAAEQQRVRTLMAARLRSVTNADGSRGLYDPVTGVGASAGSVAVDAAGAGRQSSPHHTYLWMIAVEINDGASSLRSTPQHFRMIGSGGMVYQPAAVSHLAGSSDPPLRQALVLRGQTNQGFLAFAIPSNRARPSWFVLLWHEEPGTAWRVLCHVQIAANGHAVLLR